MKWFWSYPPTEIPFIDELNPVSSETVYSHAPTPEPDMVVSGQ